MPGEAAEGRIGADRGHGTAFPAGGRIYETASAHSGRPERNFVSFERICTVISHHHPHRAMSETTQDRVPVLPEVDLNLLTPKSPATARIVENRVATRESSPNIVRHITFDLTGTGLEGRLRTGQSIGVLPPGTDAKGKPHKVRLYSLSSPTAGEGGQPHLASTTVKRAIDEVDGRLYTGVASNYLCDLKPGDEVQVSGPSGKRFLLPVDADQWNYVFFGTGTGVAPFRAMIGELYEAPYTGSCALVFGCAYRTDLLYAEEFESLAARESGFHYLLSVSREGRRADGSKDYVQSKLVDRADVLLPLLRQPNTLVYICGLKGMEHGIYQGLLAAGLEEYFEFRGERPADPASLDREAFRKAVKAGPRIFEEVY